MVRKLCRMAALLAAVVFVTASAGCLAEQRVVARVGPDRLAEPVYVLGGKALAWSDSHSVHLAYLNGSNKTYALPEGVSADWHYRLVPSPDGKLLPLHSVAHPEISRFGQPGKVWEMDLSSGRLTELVSIDSPLHMASYSTDAKSLAILAKDGRNYVVYVYGRGQKKPKLLWRSSGQLVSLAGWTADGKRIYLVSKVESGVRLMQIESKTGALTPVSSTLTGVLLPETAVVDAAHRGMLYCADRKLYVCDLAGKNRKNLLNTGGAETCSAMFSHSGRYISAEYGSGDTPHTVVINTASGVVARVGDAKHPVHLLDWHPSRDILLTSDAVDVKSRSRDIAVYEVDVTTLFR